MIKIDNNLKIKGHYKIRAYKKGTKELIRESEWIENLIVLNENNGLYLVLERLLGNTTYSLEITKGKIGYGTSTPTSSDTDIETLATDNIFLANTQRDSNSQITLIFFANDSELTTSGTPYSEFTIHCGSQLFARSLISPTYSKSDGEDTQIEYVISCSET